MATANYQYTDVRLQRFLKILLVVFSLVAIVAAGSIALIYLGTNNVTATEQHGIAYRSLEMAFVNEVLGHN